MLLSRPEPVGVAWPTVLAFLRLTTNPRVFAQAFLPDEAMAIVSSWLTRPNISILQARDRHWSIFSKLVSVTHARGPLMMDAHLAALAIEHGAQLATTDRDFRRFPNLRVLNPLED
jgi:toxin-antitoxin system PIN domain toxin